MPFITLGTTSQLQIKVPTRGSTGWDEIMRSDTFLKIAEHDHTGSSGKGIQLSTGALAADSVTGAKIRLDNDEYLRGRNNANSADKNIIKVNTSDELEFGTTVGTVTIQDDGLTILDNADNTKVIAFNAASITTGTTRTLTSPDASGTIVLEDNTATLSSKTLTSPVLNGTLSGTAFLDEDTMTSNSATAVASQQSIKAYVDSQVTAQDLDIAGDTGTDSIDLDSETLTFTGGTGIDTSASSGTSALTIAIDSTVATLTGAQTLTNKTIASASNTLTIDADVSTVSNIKNAEIKAGAAIALNKLAAATASRALVSDASGFITAATTTSTEIGYVNGVTSAIQTQIDGKLPTTITTTGDIIYSSSGSTAARLGIGSAGQVLQVSGGVPAWGTNTASPIATVSKTTTYTATTSDDVILVDTSGGAWTLTLYAASGNSGRRLKIIKTTSDTNALTVDGNASETINGNTTTTVDSQYESLEIVCDGSNWFIENRKSGTAWTSYTPTGSWSTNTTYAGEWRRVGDTMEVTVKMSLSGAPNAANLSSITIPSGYIIDTGKTSTDQGQTTLGSAHWYDSVNSTLYDGSVTYNDTTSVRPMCTRTSGTAGSNAAVLNHVDIWTKQSGDELFMQFSVPISGWKGDNE